MTILSKRMKAVTVFHLERSMAKDAKPFNHLFMDSDDALRQMNEEIALREAQIQDPPASGWSAIGAAPVSAHLPFWQFGESGDDETVDPDEEFFVPLDDGRILGVIEIRNRILPGDVLRAEIEKECVVLQAKQDEEITRKQRMEIKDAVAARLLAKALIKPQVIPVVFSPSFADKDVFDVLVFTGSRKTAEDVTAYLRNVFGSFPVTSFDTDLVTPLKGLLTEILRNPDDARVRGLLPGNSVKLDHARQGKYSLSDESLMDNDVVKDLLAGFYLVDRLEMRYFGKGVIEDAGFFLLLRISAKGAITGMKLSELASAEAATEDDDAYLDLRAWTYLFLRELEGFLSLLDTLAREREGIDMINSMKALKSELPFDLKDENDLL